MQSSKLVFDEKPDERDEKIATQKLWAAAAAVLPKNRQVPVKSQLMMCGDHHEIF